MDWIATAANASLISIRSRSATRQPGLAERAGDGVGRLRMQRVVRAGHHAVRADLGDPLESRRTPAARSALVTTTAQAPSDGFEAEPAVMVPSLLKAAGSARLSVASV